MNILYIFLIINIILNRSLSPGFAKYINSEGVGYLFDIEEGVIKNVRLAIIHSYNTKETVDCDTIVALIIYYVRIGMKKE